MKRNFRGLETKTRKLANASELICISSLLLDLFAANCEKLNSRGARGGQVHEFPLSSLNSNGPRAPYTVSCRFKIFVGVIDAKGLDERTYVRTLSRGIAATRARNDRFSRSGGKGEKRGRSFDNWSRFSTKRYS